MDAWGCGVHGARGEVRRHAQPYLRPLWAVGASGAGLGGSSPGVAAIVLGWLQS